MKERPVVTSFLRRGCRVLVLRRSQRVRTHRGKWAAVSGGIEGADPLEQALLEVREETGLADDELRLVRAGQPLRVPDAEHGVEWVVHPFLFDFEGESEIRLDWEHTECRWVDPGELGTLDTVPMLAETWERLWRT
ncbi:MAG: NUDIX pyrophosphatase [Chloroflexi bacterium]|nr:NUDIX pyrophosphatase [Chloroflexota bacterium]